MKSLVLNVQQKFLRLYNATHWFSDKEAWLLFRTSAFLETLGWTLLISAIVYRRLEMPNPDIVISIAGRLHGVFFLLYFIALLLLARSMEWKALRIIIALAAGVPPYGSLVFEKYIARLRKATPPKVQPPKDFDK